jgi:TPP-dependent pyruvate/acetoin dehydrogenase alpha subunit
MTIDYVKAFTDMLKIRMAEEWILRKLASKELSGTAHTCIGQEAVAVGVCHALEKEDAVFSNHRGHGHMIAKGMSIKSVLCEIAGLDQGACGGLGGSQHIAQPSIGFFGSNGIVGGGVPVATGYAMALKSKNLPYKSVVFFGDGASNQGVVYEAMNMAVIWQLPVMFICENNLYGMSAPAQKFVAGSLVRRAESFGIFSYQTNGMSVSSVYEIVQEARRKIGPTFIEAMTYRFCGHSKSDQEAYRSKSEVEQWRKKDPLLEIQLYLDVNAISIIKNQIIYELEEVERLIHERS